MELFFLLGNPIKWKVSDESGDADAFSAYKQFLREIRFDSKMRQAKRLAGAETQSAKLYHIYRDEATGLPWVKIVVLSKSNGYTLRLSLIHIFRSMQAACSSSSAVKRSVD